MPGKEDQMRVNSRVLALYDWAVIIGPVRPVRRNRNEALWEVSLALTVPRASASTPVFSNGLRINESSSAETGKTRAASAPRMTVFRREDLFIGHCFARG